MNYNLECEKILNSIDLNHKPTLLLHSCCAPCSSAVLERISKYFSITILFYNPNITDYEEYLKRKEELKRLCMQVFATDSFTVVSQNAVSYAKKLYKSL